MLSSTTPTPWARELVVGAFDLHVHVAPDVMERRVTDLELARRCREVGLAGFVLKSHYVSTAERAAVVSAAMDGEVVAIGALTLNAAVGGMNPIAVEIAAREGARVLWMPTVDALNHRESARGDARGRGAAHVAGAPGRSGRAGHHDGPVLVLDSAGRPLPSTREVLALAAKHQLVVATGHLSASRRGQSPTPPSRPGCGT